MPAKSPEALARKAEKIAATRAARRNSEIGSKTILEQRKTFGKDRWDQGLGTIRLRSGREVVPFLTEATCRKMAFAAAAAGYEVSFDLVDGMWVYWR